MKNNARAAFYREYSHGVTDRRRFEESFSQREVSRRWLTLGKDLTVGNGFAVRMGRLQSSMYTGDVVVRCVDAVGNVDAQTNLLREAMAMHQFRHENLLSLLCLCADALPVYVVTEYMANGDLRSYLRSCRPEATSPRQALGLAELSAMAMKATAAMVYLERQHIVHRALAAHQYFVGKDASDIRLSNLGSTRDIYLVSGGGLVALNIPAYNLPRVKPTCQSRRSKPRSCANGGRATGLVAAKTFS
jgi:serine/threonine protein kinase